MRAAIKGGQHLLVELGVADDNVYNVWYHLATELGQAGRT